MILNTMLSVRTVSDLTGWPVRTVRYKAQNGQLPAQSVLNARNRKEYLIPLSELPADLQRKWYMQQGENTVTTEQLLSAEDSRKSGKSAPSHKELDEYTLTEREQIAFWIQTVS